MSPPKPSEDAIRRRAHEIWQRRGPKPGSSISDWLQAERELTAEAAPAAAPAPPTHKSVFPPPSLPPAPAPKPPAQPSAPSPAKGKKKKK